MLGRIRGDLARTAEHDLAAFDGQMCAAAYRQMHRLLGLDFHRRVGRDHGEVALAAQCQRIVLRLHVERAFAADEVESDTVRLLRAGQPADGLAAVDTQLVGNGEVGVLAAAQARVSFAARCSDCPASAPMPPRPASVSKASALCGTSLSLPAPSLGVAVSKLSLLTVLPTLCCNASSGAACGFSCEAFACITPSCVASGTVVWVVAAWLSTWLSWACCLSSAVAATASPAGPLLLIA
jgi:hypothetical protein